MKSPELNTPTRLIIDLFRAHWHTFGFISFMLSSLIQIVINVQAETGGIDPVLWFVGFLLFFFGGVTLIDMTLLFVIDALRLLKRL